MKLRKIHVVTKTIFHCFIGVIEVLLIPLFIAFLSTYFSPFESGAIFWQWVERWTFCFFIYEVLIIYVRKMIVDTRNDALLALKTSHEQVLLCFESESQNEIDRLNCHIDKLISISVLNQTEIINKYNNLKLYLETKNVTRIKYEIIDINHKLNANALLWNYTLILRYFK